MCLLLVNSFLLFRELRCGSHRMKYFSVVQRLHFLLELTTKLLTVEHFTNLRKSNFIYILYIYIYIYCNNKRNPNTNLMCRRNRSVLLGVKEQTFVTRMQLFFKVYTMTVCTYLLVEHVKPMKYLLKGAYS